MADVAQQLVSALAVHCPLLSRLSLFLPYAGQRGSSLPPTFIASLCELRSVCELVLRADGLTLDDLFSLMSCRMPSLRHLNLSDCSMMQRPGQEQQHWANHAEVDPCPCLTSVLLPRYDSDYHARPIGFLLQRHPALRYLGLSGSDPDPGATIPDFSPWHTLTSLDVRLWLVDPCASLVGVTSSLTAAPSSSASSSSAVGAVPVPSPVLPNFKEFSCVFHSKERHVRPLSDRLALLLHHYSSRLQCLDLSGSSVQYQLVLATCLACPQLRLLNLHTHNDCSATTMYAEARLVASLPESYAPLVHLSAVSLKGEFRTEAHLLAILAAFPAVTHLRLRNVSETRALPLSLSALPILSRSCPVLQHLEITQIADTFFQPSDTEAVRRSACRIRSTHPASHRFHLVPILLICCCPVPVRWCAVFSLSGDTGCGQDGGQDGEQLEPASRPNSVQ